MKDNDQSANLKALIDAGIRSFKIEGRYKDAPYVKNITAHYRLLLDKILEQSPELSRASSGSCDFHFRPDPEKTFHRGSTDYFVSGRTEDIGAFDSPKFVGQPIGTVTRIGPDWFEVDAVEPIHNGDGLSYMKNREALGTRVNRAEKHGQFWRVFPNEPVSALGGLKAGVQISRNRDHEWEQALLKNSAERRIGVHMLLAETEEGLALTLTDEDGCTATAHAKLKLETAKRPPGEAGGVRENLSRLGNTCFAVKEIVLDFSRDWFIPASTVNAMRREVVQRLEAVRLASRVRPGRRAPVDPPVPYPADSLTYLANVYNGEARAFYEKHGVKLIDAAYEAHEEAGDVSLMITKHCLRYSFQLCPKQAKGVTGVQGQVRAEPMVLEGGGEKLTLRFDCRACEMHVVGKIRKSVLASPPPSVMPITFHR
jgi:putative protease